MRHVHSPPRIAAGVAKAGPWFQRTRAECPATLRAQPPSAAHLRREYWRAVHLGSLHRAARACARAGARSRHHPRPVGGKGPVAIVLAVCVCFSGTSHNTRSELDRAYHTVLGCVGVCFDRSTAGSLHRSLSQTSEERGAGTVSRRSDMSWCGPKYVQSILCLEPARDSTRHYVASFAFIGRGKIGRFCTTANGS